MLRDCRAIQGREVKMEFLDIQVHRGNLERRGRMEYLVPVALQDQPDLQVLTVTRASQGLRASEETKAKTASQDELGRKET